MNPIIAGTKRCYRCKEDLPLDQFGIDRGRKDGLNPRCILCGKEADKAIYIKLRETILDAYGGECKCCGEDQYVFLAIDHMNGGGYSHRKRVGQGSAFYRWIIRNNYPTDLQILCHNCNMAKRTGVCPHQQ